MDDPSVGEMRAALGELDQPDEEHPNAWLSHESGWTLDAYESGLLIWENLEEESNPRHMLHVPRERVLQLWLLLAKGELQAIESLPWQPGYGPLT